MIINMIWVTLVIFYINTNKLIIYATGKYVYYIGFFGKIQSPRNLIGKGPLNNNNNNNKGPIWRVLIKSIF